MAVAAILNFAKSGILGHSNPCLADVYQCTNFGKNVFIYDRDMAKNRKFKIAPGTILNFASSRIFATVILVWPISISLPNLTDIASFTTEIWPKIEKLGWRLPPS